MTNAPEVTGRDRYIIAQALYEFIRLEQSKPMGDADRMSETQKRSYMSGSTTNCSS